MRAIVSFLLTLLLSVSLWAQDPLVVTLDESIGYALDQNPQIKKAEKEKKKADAAVWESYSTILPQINGNASVQHAWDIQTNRIPNFIKPMLGDLVNQIPGGQDMPDFVEISFGLENTFRYGLTLTQPLFLGGSGIAGIQMAQAGKQAAGASLEQTRQTIIFQTTQAFYQCLLSQAVIDVQEKALQQAEANLDMVAKKYNVGTASRLDRMRAEVEVANIKPKLISARNDYKRAKTQLRTILGIQDDVKLDITGAFQYVPDAFSQRDLKDLKQLALKNRPEWVALQAQQRISSKSVAMAKSQFLPKVIFQTDYSFQAMQDDWELRQDNFSKGFTSAVSLSVPLFSGFKNTKQYQKARLDERILQDSEKQLHDAILAEVESAYHNFQEAIETYESSVESVNLAEEALRLANLTYEEGVSTQLDVLSSQLALTQARLNNISSIYSYQMARYQLRKATGKLDRSLAVQ
jgi:outer membrane protein TolC